MNLSNLLLDLYRRQGFKTAPTTEVVTRFTAYINQTQREILSQKGLTALRSAVVQFSSIAADPFVTLPLSAVRVMSVQDRTNQVSLQSVPLSGIRDADPGLISAAAIPYAYSVVNLSSPTFQYSPTTLANLSVSSDSAADGATKTAYVEYVAPTTSGHGIYVSTSVALNGVTLATFSTLAGIIVTKFYIGLTAGGPTTATGNVTLFQGGAGSTALATIAAGRSFTRYTRLQLWPTPSAAVTYYADVELHIDEMVNGGDEPYLPEDFHWLLGSGAMMKEYQRKGDQIAYAMEKSMYKSGLGDLKLWVARAQSSSSNVVPSRHSMLGPNFPAGS